VAVARLGLGIGYPRFWTVDVCPVAGCLPLMYKVRIEILWHAHDLRIQRNDPETASSG
jgi:hypothetical protein